jgi:hypothetical protein
MVATDELSMKILVFCPLADDAMLSSNWALSQMKNLVRT